LSSLHHEDLIIKVCSICLKFLLGLILIEIILIILNTTKTIGHEMENNNNE
jgi:hypothetical protein